MIADDDSRLLRKLRRPEMAMGLGLRLGLGSGGQAPATVPSYTGQIWTRSFAPNKSRSGSTSYSSITRHVVADNPATQQIILPGTYTDDALAVQNTGAYSSTFTIEQPINTVIGSGSASVAGDGTDSAPATITYTTLPAIGSQVIVRQAITTAGSGVLIPYTANGGGDQLWTDETSFPLYPRNVIGTTTKPSFGVETNSRAAGNGGTPDANGNVAEITRSLAGYAWVATAVPSNSIDNVVRYRKERITALQYVTHIWFNGPRPGSAATAQQEADITWANLQNAFKIFPTKAIAISTTPPKPDDYVTPDPLNASRLIFNGYVRAAGAPVRSFADIAHVTGIDPTDVGLYANTSYLNTDYTHETDAGYSAIQASGTVNVNGFARATAYSQAWSMWQLSQMQTQAYGSWITPNDAACLHGNSFLTCKNNFGAFRQTDATKQPAIISVLSGTASGLQFDGTNDELDTSTSPRDEFSSINTSVNGGLYVALVIPGAIVGGSKIWFHASTGLSTSSSRFQLALATGNLPRLTIRRRDADSAIVRSATEALTAGTPYLVIAYCKITTTSSLAIRINGTFATNGTEGGAFPLSGLSGTNGNWEDTRCAAVYWGSSGGANFSNETFIERFSLPGAPTLSEVQKIEGDIMWRHGLQASLPSDHPYKLAAPT